MRITVKEKIIRAYFTLLKTKTYNEITITDITNTANVSRTSFYRNFVTYGDLLNEIGERIYKRSILDMMPKFINNKTQTWREVATKIFTNIKSGDSFLVNIKQSNHSYLIAELEKRMDVSAVEKLSIDEKYNPVINICIILMAGIAWSKRNCQEPLEDMVNYVMTRIA